MYTFRICSLLNTFRHSSDFHLYRPRDIRKNSTLLSITHIERNNITCKYDDLVRYTGVVYGGKICIDR